METTFKTTERIGKLPSAGPSNPNRAVKRQDPHESLSDSESDDSDDMGRSKKNDVTPPGEYDPAQYNDLDVSDDIREQFQFITK